MRIQICVDPWEMRGRVFLGNSSYIEKVKEGMRWSLFIAWLAKSWSLGFVNMQDTLALHVLNFNWLHVSEISTILSHASCLIKTPTMYVIT